MQPRQRQVLQPLMRPFLVVMDHIFLDQMVKMLLPEDDEMVQALLLNRLHEPLDICLQVR